MFSYSGLENGESSANGALVSRAPGEAIVCLGLVDMGIDPL